MPLLPQVHGLLGTVVGQLFVDLVCDRGGRKVALVFTTLLIALGAALGTVADGAYGSVEGLFWLLTFARGITGIGRIADTVRSLILIILPRTQGVGGEYPASSTSASEAANEQMLSKRGLSMPPGLVVLRTMSGDVHALSQFSSWRHTSFLS